jgi:hypothetical protein
MFFLKHDGTQYIVQIWTILGLGIVFGLVYVEVSVLMSFGY